MLNKIIFKIFIEDQFRNIFTFFFEFKKYVFQIFDILPDVIFCID